MDKEQGCAIGLISRAMNHKAIAITNWYQALDGQEFPFSYIKIYTQHNQKAFTIADKKMLCNHPMLQ